MYVIQVPFAPNVNDLKVRSRIDMIQMWLQENCSHKFNIKVIEPETKEFIEGIEISFENFSEYAYFKLNFFYQPKIDTAYFIQVN